MEELKRALDKEIEIINKHMNYKYGKENMEKFHTLMDERLSIAIKKEFDNFAEIKMDQ